MAKEKKYGESSLYDEAPLSYGQRMDITRAKKRNQPSFFDKLMAGSKKVKERAEAKAKAKSESDIKMARAKSKFQETVKKAETGGRKLAEPPVKKPKSDTSKSKIDTSKAKAAISAARRDEAKTKQRDVTPATARDRAKTRIAPKGSIKDPRKALDAETRKSYEKRISYMEKRKAAGKNYSKKNLAELKEKLK